MSDYFYEDLPECDVVIEPGWSAGPNHSCAIIGVLANSNKGAVFLTAYCDEDWDGECANIESGSFPPEEFDKLTREARLAGVSYVWRGKDRSEKFITGELGEPQ